ncbi:ty3-gypsy retrotransposon protein [Cucumis melo var. makuwa]|uniref:Ty3-gypsy retrotransposon protein n=1 Tax=Cucumis melo var. makuwa TaxID=1194695 RepID=A0A5A7U8B3_CUCMM|nr:ty3-gypsy retrotransposon protein [Cucumis melo var. makuwa]
MALKKGTSNSFVVSDAYTGPITCSRSKGITQEQDQGSNVAQSIPEQLMESPKAGIVIKENPLYDNSDSTSSKSKKEAHPDVMSVIMADITGEAAMAEMERKINFLVKVVEEQDHEITALREQMRTRETTELSQTPVVKATDKGKNVVQENQQRQQSISVASLSVQQLQNMITNSIKAQYQPPKFQQFDGKGNAKQHIAHFVETCENAGSKEDKLFRQFVRSLKGNAFEWYIDLESEVIDSWEQLEKEFLNRFYSIRPVELCTQGMHWGCLYILQGIKSRTFEELATRAHDMELSIVSRGTKDFPVPEIRKDKETNIAEKVVKSTVKESMVVNTIPLKFSKRKEGRAEKKDDGSERRQQLLEKQLIQLSECKRPEQAGKLDNPNYCKYHQVISHSVEKCFMLKELIPRLAHEKKIELDLEEIAQNNHAAAMIMSEALSPRLIFEQKESLVQSIEEDDEGWTVVTRRNKRKSTPIQKEPRFYRNYRRGNKAQKNKKKKKTPKLKLVDEEDKDFPRTQRLVTLADFFPTRFLCDHQDENPGVVACHAINATKEESISLRSLEEEGVSKYLLRFNVDDLLSLPQETKTILINALLSSAASSSSAPTVTYESTTYCMSIDFSDEDLLLGSKLHNRPLYVSGYVLEERVDRILVYNRSTVNIMPKSTIRQLGILIEELSNSKLVIQGFIQGSQRVMGMIRLELIIGDLKASALFHCFKFYQDGVKKVEADSNQFSEAESHFADAKFYLKNDSSPEVVSVEVPLSEASTSTTKSVIFMDEKNLNPPILRYVPPSRRKKGEAQFVESPQGLKVGDIEVLKESFTTPVTKITKQEIKIDLTEASLPQRQTKDGFDPKAYKLMAKAGSLKVKRYDVILTNPEKEDSEQVECEISCHHITILEELKIKTPKEDAEDIPQSLENGGQSTVDELKEVNLGTIEEPRPTFISGSLSSEEEGKSMSLLTEYKDIFSWSYKEMPRLDPKVAVHHLAIKPRYRPIKQAQQRFRPELIPQIEVEVNKLIEVGFIREVKYPTWIANIVPFKKKERAALCLCRLS